MQVRMGQKQETGYSDVSQENERHVSSDKKKQGIETQERDEWQTYLAAKHQSAGSIEEYDGAHLDTDDEYSSIQTLANEIQNLGSTEGNTDTQGQKIRYKELQVSTKIQIQKT